MTLKSFCSRLKSVRLVSTALLTALGLLAVVLGPRGTRVYADSVPEWMRAAARDSLPPAEKDAVAVILLDETVTIVKENGDMETTYRRVYKILRPEARQKFGALQISFNDDTRITSLKAWGMPANGKEIEIKEKDAAETGETSDDLYSNLRFKDLLLPAMDPGNFVGYEYTQKDRPYLFADKWSFQNFIPVRRARYQLQLPPGWEVKTEWANYPELKETPSGTNSFSWELENIPAISDEPDMPPFQAIAGRMAVKFFPRDLALRTKAAGSWNDIALWYAGLTSSSRDSTPEIKQKVSELTANSKTTLDKIKALTSFMQRDIRYVAIEIGIGGFQPHPASAVFHYRYGDCKDKATLLGTMLQEIGVQSYYVVAQTTRGIVMPDLPATNSFNHMIIAIHLPDDVPSGGLWSIIDHPKYGRLLIFDPTNPYTPLGYIPTYEQSNYGLLVTPTGGELISLPLLPPSTNRLLRTGEFTLTSNGSLIGEVNEIRWGAPAVDARSRLLESAPADRPHLIENFLGWQLGNFHLTSATVGNLDDVDQTLVLHYKFVVDDYARIAGNLLLVRPRVLGVKTLLVDPGKPRKYPFQFEDASVESDDFKISIPPGYVADDLPLPADVKSNYGSYKSKLEVNGNSLHYQRVYQINSVYIPTTQLPDLREFFGRISTDERASAVLRRSP